MRAFGRRKKKLIVAFHFQGSSQAGWNCEQCRRQGLEVRRRCGFLPEDRRGVRRVVWARGGAASEECPKSVVTAESVAWVERFWVWKFEGGGPLMELGAREAEAVLVLERESRGVNG